MSKNLGASYSLNNRSCIKQVQKYGMKFMEQQQSYRLFSFSFILTGEGRGEISIFLRKDIVYSHRECFFERIKIECTPLPSPAGRGLRTCKHTLLKRCQEFQNIIPCRRLYTILILRSQVALIHSEWCSTGI